jgi:hypothetical protein
MNKRMFKQIISVILAASLTVTLFAGVIGVRPETAAAAGAVRIEPEADAQVDGGSGSATQQSVNYDNPANNLFAFKEDSNQAAQYPFTRRIFFRFDLSALPDPGTVTSVKLKVNTNGLPGGTGDSADIVVYAVSDNTWSESTLTWLNKPEHSTPIGSFQLGAAAGYYEVDITDYVKAQKSVGKASLMLINTSSTQRQIYSKERQWDTQRPHLAVTVDETAPVYESASVHAGFGRVDLNFNEPIMKADSVADLKANVLLARNGVDYAPLGEHDSAAIAERKLTITLNEPLKGDQNKLKVLAGTLSDAAANTIAADIVTSGLLGSDAPVPEPVYENKRELQPIADVYVDSGAANVNTNYGSNASMPLKEGGSTYNRRIFMKFNVADVATINNALLRVYFTGIDVSADSVKVYAVADDSWAENTMNWNNQPAYGTLIGEAHVNGAPGWYEWNVTDYINEQKSGDKTASLIMIGTSTPSNRVAVSKEAADRQPHLLLDYDMTAPALTGAEISQENKRVDLLFNELIVPNKTDLNALKAEITLARDGAMFTALAAGDSVRVEQNKLIIELENRLSAAGAKISINANTIKDKANNVNETALVTGQLDYDVAAPVIEAAGLLAASNKALTIRANEPLFSALANAAALKQAVTYAADGVNFGALGEGDSAVISGGELVVTLTEKFAAGSKVNIAAGAVKDAAGNAVAAEWTSTAVVADNDAPSITGAYVINFNKKVVLLFNEAVAANGLNEAQLKAAIRRSANGGATYAALGANDGAKLSGNTLTISLAEPLEGAQNRFEVAASALRDFAGNVAESALTSGTIAAELAVYPYAPPSPDYLTSAMVDSVSLKFGNLDAATGSQPETMSAGAVATLAMAIAAGDRDPAYIDRYVETIKKTISIEANMPNLMAGLDSRQQSPLMYAIALLWNDEEVMARFTEAERSKLVTLFKAGLIATAYTLSDYNEDDNWRGGQRIGVNGDTNVWNGGNTNHSEPNVTIFMAASFVLGLENVKSILQSYDFQAFNAELEAQGLTAVLKSFNNTQTYGNLTSKANMIEKIVHSNKWEFKGITLDEYIANPMKLYHETQRYMWELIAEDGDYIGQRGMGQEFFSTDQAGNRQSSSYVVLGIDPSLLNRILLHYFGFWSTPDNREIADEIDQWQKVGVSDYYAKVVNGYYTQSWMGTKMEYLTEYKYFVETMISLGLLNKSVFNDTFSYTDMKPLTDNWILPSGNWTVVNDSIIPYNTKVPLTSAPGATPVYPDEKLLTESGVSPAPAIAYTKKSFNHISYMAWVKAAADSEVGLLGRVTDANNYYLLSYADGKLAIKKNVNGTLTTLAETTFAWTEGQAYRFRGTFTDDKIDLYVNGVLKLSAVDSSHPTGRIGLYNHGGAARIDGILVQNTTPGVPNLQSLEAGSGKLTVRFGAVEGAMQYNVKYGTQPGQYTSTVVSAKTEVVLAGLENDTTYYVAVSAQTAVGESANSAELFRAPSVPTAIKPQLTSVIADGSDVLVNFTEHAINTSYRIKYGMESGRYTTTVDGVAGSGHRITLPISQAPYYFAVEALNDKGSSGLSNEWQGSGNGTLLFSDDFNDGEYASDWVLSVGAPVMENGKLKTASGNPERLWLRQGNDWKDYVITTKFTLPSQDMTKEIGVLARVDTAATYYVAGYKYDKAAGTEKVTLRRKVNNAFLPDIAADFVLDKNITEHTLKASFNGSDIQIYIDGTLALETTDTSLTTGTVGIFSVITPVYFDDFAVELLNGLPKPVIASATASGTTAAIKFNEIAGATGYKIKYGTQSHSYSNQLVAADYSENGVELTGLTAGQTYYVTVSAYNAKLESENASEAEVTIAVTTPSPNPTPTPASTPSPAATGNPGGNAPVIKDGVAKVKPVVSGSRAKAVMAPNAMNTLFTEATVDEAGVKRGIIEIAPAVGADSYAQELPAAWFAAGNGAQRLEIRTEAGTITLSDEMLSTVDLAGATSVELLVERGDPAQLGDELRDKIGNRPILELQVLVDGKPIKWNNNRAPVSVAMDYVPTAEENNNPEHIIVWYIDGNGQAVNVPSGRYDAATGKVTFTTTHFSSYAVGYEVKTFGDLAGYAWAKQPIEVLASKGIIKGVSASSFAPGAAITRADFLLLLVRTLNLQADATSSFTDTAPSDYYYEALGIAKELGIAKGTGDNRFNPRAAITREDMIVLTARALKAAGKQVGTDGGSPLQDYQDASEVADYALESVRAFVSAGLIKGDGDRLEPKANTLRAHVAVLLYRIYNLV